MSIVGVSDIRGFNRVNNFYTKLFIFFINDKVVRHILILIFTWVLPLKQVDVLAGALIKDINSTNNAF